MSESGQQLWSHGEPDSSHGLSIPDDDFTALFNSADFDLDLSTYNVDGSGSGDAVLHSLQNATGSTTSNSTPGESGGFDLGGISKDLELSSAARSHHHHMNSMTQPFTTAASDANAMAIDYENHGMFDSRGAGGGSSNVGSMGNVGNQYHQSQQQHRRQHNQPQPQPQHHHRLYGIPPTPSSMEMQAQSLTQFIDQAFLDQLHGIKDDQMVFTPLISPAVGPLEASYNQLQDFTIPGSYLSPLTSPALEDHASMMRLPRSREQSFSESTSPVDPRENTTREHAAPANIISGTNSIGRSKAISARTASRVVRQSPSMKPQKKKPPPQLLSNPEIADAAIAEARNTPRSSTYQDVLKMTLPESSGASSSADSISPEPISDALMPPPPPKSKTSAARLGEGEVAKRTRSNPKDIAINIKKAQNGVAPMTPAQLMNISNPTPARDKAGDIPMGEAVLTVEASDKVDKKASSRVANGGSSKEGTQSPMEEEQQTPKLSSMKRKSSATMLAPSRSKTGAQSGDAKEPESSRTPLIAPALAPAKPSAGTVRKDIRPATTHGRRGSTAASPALQPRLSPAMKPLLPEGAHTSALLLATRSNYENIVSGTHSQLGLSYPEHLSINLTSKKTSHKIAEKGRRNRINNALSEIASLLPRAAATGSTSGSAQSPRSEKGSSKSPPGTPQMTASKASTVEQAIEYIKSLQKQLAETQSRLAVAEAEIKTLKEVKQE